MLPNRKPIFEGDSDQELSKNDELLREQKGYVVGKNPGKGGKKSKAKKLPIPRHRFEGNERIDLINYAMKHGAVEAAVHFSDALGVAVSEGSIRQIVKKHLSETTGIQAQPAKVLPSYKPGHYNRYSLKEKRQMAKYCMKYGPTQTSTYLTRLWGTRVSPTSIRNIVKWYKKTLSEEKGLLKEDGLKQEMGLHKENDLEMEKGLTKANGPEQ